MRKIGLLAPVTGVPKVPGFNPTNDNPWDKSAPKPVTENPYNAAVPLPKNPFEQPSAATQVGASPNKRMQGLMPKNQVAKPVPMKPMTPKGQTIHTQPTKISQMTDGMTTTVSDGVSTGGSYMAPPTRRAETQRKLDYEDPWEKKPRAIKRKIDTTNPWKRSIDKSDPWEKTSEYYKQGYVNTLKKFADDPSTVQRLLHVLSLSLGMSPVAAAIMAPEGNRLRSALYSLGGTLAGVTPGGLLAGLGVGLSSRMPKLGPTLGVLGTLLGGAGGIAGMDYGFRKGYSYGNRPGTRNHALFLGV